MTDDDDAKIMEAIPPCYRFSPHDYELIYIYLQKKLLGLPLPFNRIYDVNLYSYSPDFLAKNYKPWGEQEWYFFTPRYRKYRNGSRPKRDAVNGYWKATGVDNPIMMKNQKIGTKKALVFYQGKHSKGTQTKTNWKMTEFRVADNKNSLPTLNSSDDCMRLDDWVLCKIYRKRDTGGKTKTCRKKARLTLPTESNQLHAISNNGLINQENNLEPPYESTAIEPTQTTEGLYHAPPEFPFDQPFEEYLNSLCEEIDMFVSSNKMWEKMFMIPALTDTISTHLNSTSTHSIYCDASS